MRERLVFLPVTLQYLSEGFDQCFHRICLLFFSRLDAQTEKSPSGENLALAVATSTISRHDVSFRWRFEFFGFKAETLTRNTFKLEQEREFLTWRRRNVHALILFDINRVYALILFLFSPDNFATIGETFFSSIFLSSPIKLFDTNVQPYWAYYSCVPSTKSHDRLEKFSWYSQTQRVKERGSARDLFTTFSRYINDIPIYQKKIENFLIKDSVNHDLRFLSSSFL